MTVLSWKLAPELCTLFTLSYPNCADLLTEVRLLENNRHSQQWCSHDRNLQDRDLVKILRRDRDFIKNSETETWSSRPRIETSKFVHFAEFFLKDVVITSESNFFHISGIFPTCFGCFLPANTTNKTSLNYRNFNKPFLCKIQSLETWNFRDRDSQKWDSWPRLAKMGLETETPSLTAINKLICWSASTYPVDFNNFTNRCRLNFLKRQCLASAYSTSSHLVIAYLHISLLLIRKWGKACCLQPK